MDDQSDTTSTNLNSRLPSVRANTGAEEQAIRHEVIVWINRERGSNCRVIHELTFGERRIDLAFIYPSDIIGVEIKGPRDNLGDGRMVKQMREYSFYIPEVWLAVDAKWWEHADVQSYSYVGNTLVWGDGMLLPRNYTPKKPIRDEMCCSRLLDLLWNEEVRNVANRARLYQGYGRINSKQAGQLKNSMARLLTGHEILSNVCCELRARPSHMVGLGSSPPIARPAQAPLARPAPSFL